MPGYGEAVYGSSFYGGASEPEGWPAVDPHGVGPPRFGLRPGLGKHPGHDPAYDQSNPRRTIRYPGLDAARYPGRNAFIYVDVRIALYPNAGLFPGLGLHTGGGRVRTAVSRLAGAGQLLSVELRHFLRTTLLAGTGRLSGAPLASSAPRTTLSNIVELSAPDLTVDLVDFDEVVELEVVDKAVEL